MKTSGLIFIATFVATVNGGPVSIDSESINSIIVGNQLYFSDTLTFRSRDDALLYCQSQDGELAKVTNKSLFDTLRLSLSVQGTYWIDGIDKSTHDRFELDTRCTSGDIDFSEMSPENLVLTPKQCLALVKGSTSIDSRIQAIDCIIPNRVLCSFTLNGCEFSTPPTMSTSTTVSATPSTVTTTPTTVTTTPTSVSTTPTTVSTTPTTVSTTTTTVSTTPTSLSTTPTTITTTARAKGD